MVTGIDIVREQLRIAGGEALSVAQDDVDDQRARDRGAHQRRAPGARTSLPSPGHDRPPGRRRSGTDVRVDTACFPGWTDHAALRLAAGEGDRARAPTARAALARLRHALRHLRVEGVATTAGFALDVLEHPDVVAGRVHTRWLEEEFLPTWTPTEVAA